MIGNSDGCRGKSQIYPAEDSCFVRLAPSHTGIRCSNEFSGGVVTLEGTGIIGEDVLEERVWAGWEAGSVEK
jgi:hypothetical protein